MSESEQVSRQQTPGIVETESDAAPRPVMNPIAVWDATISQLPRLPADRIPRPRRDAA